MLSSQTAYPTDPWLGTRQSPFGGQIFITGQPFVGYAYRLMARMASQAPAMGSPITNPFTAYAFNPPPGSLPNSVVNPDPGSSEGWFTYISEDLNLYRTLGLWHPPPLTSNGLWQIRLETVTLGPAYSHLGYSPWYNVLVNNEAPTGEVLSATGLSAPTSLLGELSKAPSRRTRRILPRIICCCCRDWTPIRSHRRRVYEPRVCSCSRGYTLEPDHDRQHDALRLRCPAIYF